MNTTTAQYLIQIKTEEGTMSFFKTMPTKPKTSKGIKSQSNKLSKWVEKEYPNFIEYDITPVWNKTFKGPFLSYRCDGLS